MDGAIDRSLLRQEFSPNNQMKKPIWITVSIAMVAMLGLLAHEFVDSTRAKTVITALETERDALRQDLSIVERRLREKDQPDPARAAGRSAQSLRMSNTAPMVDHRTGQPVTELAVAGGMFMAGPGPEWMSAQMKTQLRRRYTPLFKQAGLSIEQTDKLTDLLREKQMTPIEVMEAAHAQGVAFGPESIRQFKTLVESANTAIDEQIHTLLGEPAYHQYQHFEETLSHRATVEQLASRLASVGEPLSAEQSEQLIDILAANSPAGAGASFDTSAPMVHLVGPGPAVSYATETDRVVGTSRAIAVMHGMPIPDSAVNHAQSMLTEPQQKALEQLRSEREAMPRSFDPMQFPPPSPPAPQRGDRE